MKKTFWSAIALAFFAQAPLYAGLLIEPYAGYKFSTSKDLDKFTVSGTSFESKAKGGNGYEIGGRLGWQIPILFAAVDYSFSQFEIEDSFSFNGQNISSAKTDVDENKLGFVVGAQIPLLRAWAKYIMSVKWDQKDNYLTGLSPANNYEKEVSGDGVALGVAFTALPFINLYVEYSMLNLDKIDSLTTQGVDIKSQLGVSEKRKVNTILLGVSMPFDI